MDLETSQLKNFWFAGTAILVQTMGSQKWGKFENRDFKKWKRDRNEAENKTSVLSYGTFETTGSQSHLIYSPSYTSTHDLAQS